MSDINGHCLCVSFKTFHKRIQAQDVFHELHVHVVWRVGGIREMEESLTKLCMWSALYQFSKILCFPIWLVSGWNRCYYMQFPESRRHYFDWSLCHWRPWKPAYNIAGKDYITWTEKSVCLTLSAPKDFDHNSPNLSHKIQFKSSEVKW